MQKQSNNLVCAIAMLATQFLATAAMAQTSAVKDSVVTVDQLLRIENATAREKAKKDAIAVGLTQADGSASQIAALRRAAGERTTFTVQQIMGLNGVYKADVVLNEQTFDGVKQGDVVGNCVVEEVRGQCVALRAKTIETNKKGKPAQSTANCPKACWTGIRPVASTTDSGGRPLPPDMPTLANPAPAVLKN